MDYGAIPAAVRAYLHEEIGNTPQPICDEFSTMMDLYARKYVFYFLCIVNQFGT